MQSFDEFLTFMHYLHSPLWESVLRMLKRPMPGYSYVIHLLNHT